MVRALILSGVLDEDGGLRLEIPFVSDVPAAVGADAASDDTVSADLLDAQSNVVSHALLDASPACLIPLGTVAPVPVTRLVSGAVPMPDEATGLRLTWRGKVIHESHATAGLPTVKFTWQPPGGAVSGRQTVTWQASHPDAAPLHFLLMLRRSDSSLQPVASVRAQQADVDFDLLPADRSAQVVVVTSDGFHLATDETPPFAIGRG